MMDHRDLEPVELNARDPSVLAEIGELRVRAWSSFVPDLSARLGLWNDDHDKSSRHWGVFYGQKLGAAARLSAHQELSDVPDAEVYAGALPIDLLPPIFSLNRLVIEPEFRGGGLSNKLDAVRMAAIPRMPTTVTVLAATPAGPKRLSQLMGLGFEPLGQPRPEPVGHPLQGLVTQPLIKRILPATDIVPTWNGMGWSGDVINEISERFIALTSEASGPVLDIGAAFGVATIPALEKGASVWANDLEIAHLAELQRRTPDHLRKHLTIVHGHYPDGIQLPRSYFSAIHMSQVLHFLAPGNVRLALETAFTCLKPCGHLFILAATPYQAIHADFIPTFQSRKIAGEEWPGVITNLRQYNRHWAADLVPDWLHVFDEDVLVAAVQRAGFRVECVEMFSRRGLPDFCRLDGRENLGIIAVKDAPLGDTLPPP
jgi:hypothetical protein